MMKALLLMLALGAEPKSGLLPYGQWPEAPAGQVDATGLEGEAAKAYEAARQQFSELVRSRSLPTPGCPEPGSFIGPPSPRGNLRNGVSATLRSSLEATKTGFVVRFVYWTTRSSQSGRCCPPCPCTCEGNCAPCARCEPDPDCRSESILAGVDVTYEVDAAGAVKQVKEKGLSWGPPPPRKRGKGPRGVAEEDGPVRLP